MSSLVKFSENNVNYICQTKQVKRGGILQAPYSNMRYFEANVIATSDDKTILEDIKKDMEDKLCKKTATNRNKPKEEIKINEYCSNAKLGYTETKTTFFEDSDDLVTDTDY